MSSRMILVGRFPVNLMRLDEIFEELYWKRKTPSDDLKGVLLAKIKAQNYVPPKAEEEYAEAILREYRKFCRAKKGGTGAAKAAPRTWQGIPREQVPWFPTIYEDLCDGCRKCIEFCPYDVFEWDEERDMPLVVNPLNCVVGCSSCADTCPLDAIGFPPHSMLETLRGQ